MASESQKDKKKLDEVFSEYIRLRDSDINGICTCITCGAKLFWKGKIQNGHYMPRDKLNTRFDERNCHAQCASCNLFLETKTMMVKYRWALEDKYGHAVVREIEELGAKASTRSPLEMSLFYKEAIKHYTEQVELLKSVKNI